jgi:uncharacterized protein (TIGR03435 family)
MKRFPFGGAFLVAGIIWLCLMRAPHALAQSLTFEVASVKPNVGNDGFNGGCHGIDSKYSPREGANAPPPLGRCVITDGRLSHMLGIAYGVQLGMIKGAPDWVVRGSERFNVDAKAEDPAKTTEAQLLQMLQALLVERFQLKFHREDRDMPGFELVVGKNGLKLQEAKGEEVEMTFGPLEKPVPGQPISLTARKLMMPKLAALLSQMGSGLVIDKTGLTAAYDFKLSWDETLGPSIFTALQEQLGLRMEARKVPVSFFVIESAQRPTAN